jgi:hypothetical protein
MMMDSKKDIEAEGLQAAKNVHYHARGNAERAKQRQSQAGELFGKGKDSLSSNEHQLSEVKTGLVSV